MAGIAARSQERLDPSEVAVLTARRFGTRNRWLLGGAGMRDHPERQSAGHGHENQYPMSPPHSITHRSRNIRRSFAAVVIVATLGRPMSTARSYRVTARDGMI